MEMWKQLKLLICGGIVLFSIIGILTIYKTPSFTTGTYYEKWAKTSDTGRSHQSYFVKTALSGKWILDSGMAAGSDTCLLYFTNYTDLSHKGEIELQGWNDMGHFPLSDVDKNTFAYGSFSGTLIEKTLSGQFLDNLGNIYSLQLVFENENCLHISLISSTNHASPVSNKTCIFRRVDLNTKDVFYIRGNPIVDPQYEMVTTAYLPYWGNIYVVTEEAATERTVYSNAYLVDADGNILHDIGFVLDGVNVISLYAKDIDADGFDEIIVVLGFRADYSSYIKFIYKWVGNGFVKETIEL